MDFLLLTTADMDPPYVILAGARAPAEETAVTVTPPS
jgi:hypothetical protein